MHFQKYETKQTFTRFILDLLVFKYGTLILGEVTWNLWLN